MSHSWFYRHQGKTHGPLSPDEIKIRAGKGLLDAHDLLWPDGMPEAAVSADAALNFSRFPAPGDPVLASSASGQPLPDWLEDVGRMERKGPYPPPGHSDAIPEWLVDLRMWFGLDVYAAVKRASQKTRPVGTPSSPTALGAIPNWLESWLIPEKPKVSVPVQTPPPLPPAALPVGRPISPPALTQAPLVSAPRKPSAPAPPLAPIPTVLPRPAKSADAGPARAANLVPSPPLPTPKIPTALVVTPPVSSPPSAKQEKIETLPAVAPVSVSPAPKPAMSAPLPVTTSAPAPAKPKTPISPAPPPKTQLASVFEVFATPVESVPPVLEAANLLAEKTFQETGFDVKTGQILDEVRFQTWKQQNAQPSSAENPAVTYASLFEVFRKARTAIENWVDDETNRNAILHGDLSEIKNDQGVRAILQKYASFGVEMQEKLVHHLEFMLDNRRKYYKAVEMRSGP